MRLLDKRPPWGRLVVIAINLWRPGLLNSYSLSCPAPGQSRLILVLGIRHTTKMMTSGASFRRKACAGLDPGPESRGVGFSATFVLFTKGAPGFRPAPESSMRLATGTTGYENLDVRSPFPLRGKVRMGVIPLTSILSPKGRGGYKNGIFVPRRRVGRRAAFLTNSPRLHRSQHELDESYV